ncbi:putative DNA repair transcription protein mms19 [Rosellinia necatrix]|uniref:MMS19 nucleotide excision repair protein n=1 Tax=Rosellinia necatrix TaxID=77044 RepID=A0A1S7UI70_ROSNE|nr:putative DNA repair transcription protein mms19 [Rosellinia necatrix]
MATIPKFDELALKYVLADKDEKDQLRAISEQAAQAIEESTNKRVTIGQWVASVSRWMQSSGDDDLISRAQALDFLASTLQVLSRRNDTLNADQVKLLVTFFSSLFENDHRAGITASSKALRQLVAMKHFQPSLGNEIIQSVCKLGDGFKLQAPTTRLEIYHLFWDLLGISDVAHDLEYRHGATSGFILDLLNLCRNERDPENLMLWFAILKVFLQNFRPSTDVTSEIFKAFSTYFPISLRPSATPSTITTDDLKMALRSCFSAHRCISSLSIPFLVDKLDKVDQTVAVKVDILLTLDACIVKYDDPTQSIVPHADKIWGSLKYEVRNGEIQDIIKATLKVLCSLTGRLDGEYLQSFLDNAWRDLKEDIPDPRYTAQAGRLLIAVVGAAPEAFALLMPRALEHIKKAIKNNNSVLHKRHLMALMSSVVKLRLHLVSGLRPDQYQSEDEGLLLDDYFGDSLFHDLYQPFWEEHSAASSPIEYVSILREAMQGLGALVGQKPSTKARMGRLCSDSTCEAIFSLLAKPVIVCPLKGPKYFNSVEDNVPLDLLEAGEEALRNAVPLYPPSFRYLLLQYLTSVQDAYRLQTHSLDLNSQIRSVSATLCSLIHSGTLEPDACWLNEVALINTFLQGLQWMLSEKADPKFLVVFIDAIHVTLKRALKQGETWDTNSGLTKEKFYDLARSFEANDTPEADLDQLGTTEMLEGKGAGSRRPRRAFCFYVVQKLYRRFTSLTESTIVTLAGDLSGGNPDLVSREDILLNQLGQLAASVIRTFNEDEQKALELDSEAFFLFHTQGSDPAMIPALPSCVSAADEFRTAPLSLGIIQGLWPGAIRTEIHVPALNNLVDTLTTTPTRCSEAARAAMDALLCVLANKFNVPSSSTLLEQRILSQQPLITRVHALIGRHLAANTTDSKLQIFRSALHYLAGDIARPLTGSNQNLLLTLIIEGGAMDIMTGRQLAQNLGLLVMPRECLSDDNHAIRKKLRLGWFYHRNVIPYLDRCFIGGGVEEREAVNRAVGIFSILRHVDYNIYASEVAQIVRIGIRSLSTFKVGVETESLLAVLLHILGEDPAELRGHLAALIEGSIAVYGMARNVADAAKFDPAAAGKQGGSDYRSKISRINARDRDPIATRMYTLNLFQKLTESGYDAHLLLPHRRGLLRTLATACGDAVREIRRTALKARQAWEALDQSG